MPVICVFENENIKIYIYNYDHRAPHIHIVKKGSTPANGVDMLLDGTLPHGSEGLSGKDIALVREWLQEHVEEVDAKWASAESGSLTDADPIPATSEKSLNEAIIANNDIASEDDVVTRIIALPNKVFACEFNAGTGWCLFDMKPYLDRPAFTRLKDDSVFKTIACHNGVPSWDHERIDIDPGYVRIHGQPITRKDFDYLMLTKSANLDTLTSDALSEGFLSFLDSNGK